MAELHARIEELGILKDKMRGMRISIANAVSNTTVIPNHVTNPFPSGNIYP